MIFFKYRISDRQICSLMQPPGLLKHLCAQLISLVYCTSQCLTMQLVSSTQCWDQKEPRAEMNLHCILGDLSSEQSPVCLPSWQSHILYLYANVMSLRLARLINLTDESACSGPEPQVRPPPQNLLPEESWQHTSLICSSVSAIKMQGECKGCKVLQSSGTKPSQLPHNLLTT